MLRTLMAIAGFAFLFSGRKATKQVRLVHQKIEETRHSEEARDALLENRKARALKRLLLVMDVKRHPQRVRSTFRTWKRNRVLTRTERGSGLEDVHDAHETFESGQSSEYASTESLRAAGSSDSLSEFVRNLESGSEHAVDVLRLHDMLEGLSVEALETLAESAKQRIDTPSVFIVQRGEVLVQLEGGGRVVKTIGEGGVVSSQLSLLATLANQPIVAPFDIRTSKPTVLLKFLKSAGFLHLRNARAAQLPSAGVPAAVAVVDPAHGCESAGLPVAMFGPMLDSRTTLLDVEAVGRADGCTDLCGLARRAAKGRTLGCSDPESVKAESALHSIGVKCAAELLSLSCT
eukprot:gene4953-6037_t